MAVPPDISEPDALVDQALDWVVRLKTGEPTRADVDALQRWRLQSPAHEEAFKTAARIFRAAGTAAQELAAEAAAPTVLPQRSPHKVLARRAFLGGAIAAAGYMVVRPPLGLWPSIQEMSADYRTGKGEQRKIAVAPDVSLELNTQTSIALRAVRDETQVELISGEASVAAARSGSSPFVMLAAKGRVTATRAEFNARCLAGFVSVACLKGTVDVEHGGSVVQLRETEQVSYSTAGFETSVRIDPAQVVAWQTGLLIFRERELGSVVDEVNRYRSGKIIIVNAELGRRIVNGTFRIDKLGDFVVQVQQLFGVKARALPGGIVLLS